MAALRTLARLGCPRGASDNEVIACARVVIEHSSGGKAVPVRATVPLLLEGCSDKAAAWAALLQAVEGPYANYPEGLVAWVREQAARAAGDG